MSCIWAAVPRGHPTRVAGAAAEARGGGTCPTGPQQRMAEPGQERGAQCVFCRHALSSAPWDPSPMSRSGGLADSWAVGRWSPGGALSRCERLVCAVESSSGQPSPRTALEPSEISSQTRREQWVLGQREAHVHAVRDLQSWQSPTGPQGHSASARPKLGEGRAGEAQRGNSAKGPWADLHRVGGDTDPRWVSHLFPDSPPRGRISSSCPSESFLSRLSSPVPPAEINESKCGSLQPGLARPP